MRKFVMTIEPKPPERRSRRRLGRAAQASRRVALPASCSAPLPARSRWSRSAQAPGFLVATRPRDGAAPAAAPRAAGCGRPDRGSGGRNAAAHDRTGRTLQLRQSGRACQPRGGHHYGRPRRAGRQLASAAIPKALPTVPAISGASSAKRSNRACARPRRWARASSSIPTATSSPTITLSIAARRFRSSFPTGANSRPSSSAPIRTPTWRC